MSGTEAISLISPSSSSTTWNRSIRPFSTGSCMITGIKFSLRTTPPHVVSHTKMSNKILNHLVFNIIVAISSSNYRFLLVSLSYFGNLYTFYASAGTLDKHLCNYNPLLGRNSINLGFLFFFTMCCECSEIEIKRTGKFSIFFGKVSVGIADVERCFFWYDGSSLKFAKETFWVF